MKSFLLLFALISFATLALAEDEGSSADLINGAKPAEPIISGLSGQGIKNYQGCDAKCQGCIDRCRQTAIPTLACPGICGKTLKNIQVDGDQVEEVIIFKHGVSGKETDHASITGQGIIKNYQGCDAKCENCYNTCTLPGLIPRATCAALCGKTLKNIQVDGEVEEVIFNHGLSGKETDDASITRQGIIKNNLGCDNWCRNCYNQCRISGYSQRVCGNLCGKTLKNEDANEEYPKGEVDEVIFKHEEVIFKPPRKQLQ